jgi:hypothetical protein
VTVPVAVLPQPPLLVPGLGGGADPLAGLRVTCLDLVRSVVKDAARVVVLAPEGGDRDESAGGTLAAWGVDVRAGGDDLVLPLGHTVGAWLLDAAGWTGPRHYTSAVPELEAGAALLVLADGTATRDTTSPGYEDVRAVPFDHAIAEALASGDAKRLASLDLDEATELWCHGAPALRALGEAAAGREVQGELVAYEAPFGVGYFVARWNVSTS